MVTQVNDAEVVAPTSSLRACRLRSMRRKHGKAVNLIFNDRYISIRTTLTAEVELLTGRGCLKRES